MDEATLTTRLHSLKEEHQDLDMAIAALVAAPASNQMQLARLKKRKLRLKDEIATISNQLIPDIIA